MRPRRLRHKSQTLHARGCRYATRRTTEKSIEGTLLSKMRPRRLTSGLHARELYKSRENLAARPDWALVSNPRHFCLSPPVSRRDEAWLVSTRFHRTTRCSIRAHGFPRLAALPGALWAGRFPAPLQSW